MASTRELRRHIRSIRSTRQITKAMEMVASSRMRRAMQAALASRPYAQRALDIVRDLTSANTDIIAHPLLTPRPMKHVSLFVISSDRGLAGSYDSAVIKLAREFIAQHKQAGHEIAILTMGKKAEIAFTHAGMKVAESYSHTQHHPERTDMLPLARHLTGEYRAGRTDAVFVIYTHFYSALRQEANLALLIPLSASELNQIPSDGLLDAAEAKAATGGSHLFIYEPSPEVVLDYVLPRLVEAELYQYIEESLASEFAARRLAMNNASENANSLIGELQLTYNSVRQASITQEIAEISGGVAALENQS